MELHVFEEKELLWDYIKKLMHFHSDHTGLEIKQHGNAKYTLESETSKHAVYLIKTNKFLQDIRGYYINKAVFHGFVPEPHHIGETIMRFRNPTKFQIEMRGHKYMGI